jgi:hypothetical protein
MFYISERKLLVMLLLPAASNAASLEANTLKAWDEYIDSAKARMEQRLRDGENFLWADELSDRRAKVQTGEIVVSPAGPQHPKRVPAGLIHHWVGSVFLPRVTLDDVLNVFQDYQRFKELYQPTVIDSKLISRDQTKDRFSMVFMNKSFFLKTAFETDYESRNVQIGGGRGYTLARSTRVQEIEEYGAPAQRTLREGAGSGVIWKLFSMTRYSERDGGVYLELEAIVLSRDIPASLRWIIEPIVRRISRASLSTSLRQTANAVLRCPEFVSSGQPACR